MPACVQKQENKWRVVECDTRKIVLNKAGTAIDGGGHKSKDNAMAQARAVNVGG